MQNDKTEMGRRSQRGVGLVEALVALTIVALGMVAFAGLQARLRVNSDVAKQRAEATRIAQEQIETLRAFSTVATVDAIASGTNTTSAASRISNANYQITRTVTNASIAAGLTQAGLKNLIVRVEWADRTALTVAGVVQNNQSVVLRTMIARSDPAIAGSLSLAPNGRPGRDLLGRDIRIPIVALNIGDGESVFKPRAGGTIAYVFNNDSGLVTRRCDGVSGVTNTLTQASLTNCQTISGGAHLISGFVRTSLDNSPNDNSPGGTAGDGGVTMRVDLDRTAPPVNAQGTLSQLTAAYWPLITSGTGVTTGSGASYTAPECSAEALQNVRYTAPVNFTQVNNGTTTTVTSTVVVASIPQSVTSITSANVATWVGVAQGDASTQIVNPVATGDRFVAYACLVYPTDLDANATTPNAYTARVAIWPTSGWSINTTAGTYKICRYSADYNLNGGVRVVSGSNVTSIDNQEHTYAYLNAQRSLSNQNFLIINARRSGNGNQAVNCPTDAAVEVNGQGGENYTDESTVTHQP
jgi:Tfp pilus assembly protein PilV